MLLDALTGLRLMVVFPVSILFRSVTQPFRRVAFHFMLHISDPSKGTLNGKWEACLVHANQEKPESASQKEMPETGVKASSDMMPNKPNSTIPRSSSYNSWECQTKIYLRSFPQTDTWI